jgi:hypothetical protein
MGGPRAKRHAVDAMGACTLCSSPAISRNRKGGHSTASTGPTTDPRPVSETARRGESNGAIHGSKRALFQIRCWRVGGKSGPSTNIARPILKRRVPPRSPPRPLRVGVIAAPRNAAEDAPRAKIRPWAGVLFVLSVLLPMLQTPLWALDRASKLGVSRALQTSSTRGVGGVGRRRRVQTRCPCWEASLNQPVWASVWPSIGAKQRKCCLCL